MTLLTGVFEVGSGRVPGRPVLEVNQSIQHLGAELGAIEEDGQQYGPDRREGAVPAGGAGPFPMARLHGFRFFAPWRTH